MQYYILKINNKIVRKYEIIADKDYDGQVDVDLWCVFTDDLNLAYKFTCDEFINNKNDIKYLRMYLENKDSYVNMKDEIGQYSFEIIDL